jgi:hypothetical protein
VERSAAFIRKPECNRKHSRIEFYESSLKRLGGANSLKKGWCPLGSGILISNPGLTETELRGSAPLALCLRMQP